MDLSNEFHPVPRPVKKQKQGKTVTWEETRRALKIQFEKWGITSCEAKLEGCWKTNALSFAHVDKRRYLKPGELTAVILCCIPCHMQLEALPREVMREQIEAIIKKRI